MSDANVAITSFAGGIRRDGLRQPADSGYDIVGWHTSGRLIPMRKSAPLAFDPNYLPKAVGSTQDSPSVIRGTTLACGLEAFVCKVGARIWLALPKHIKPSPPFEAACVFDLDEEGPLEPAYDASGTRQLAVVGEDYIPVIKQRARFMRVAQSPTDYLQCTNMPNLGSALTIAFWLKPSSRGTKYAVSEHTNAATVTIEPDGKFKVVLGQPGSQKTFTSNASVLPSDDRCVHLAFAYDASGAAMYLNGAKIQHTESGASVTLPQTAPLKLFAPNNASVFALGNYVIANVKASAAQIAEHYTNTRVLYTDAEPTYIWLPLVAPVGGRIHARDIETAEQLAEIDGDLFIGAQAASAVQQTYVWREKRLIAWGKLECTSVSGGTVTLQLASTVYPFPRDKVLPNMVVYLRDETQAQWLGYGYLIQRVNEPNQIQISSQSSYFQTGKRYDYCIVYIDTVGTANTTQSLSVQAVQQGSLTGKYRYVMRFVKDLGAKKIYSAFAGPTDWIQLTNQNAQVSGWDTKLVDLQTNTIELWRQQEDSLGTLTPYYCVARYRWVYKSGQSWIKASIPSSLTDSTPNPSEMLTDPFVDYYEQPSAYGLPTDFKSRQYGARGSYLVFSACGYPEYMPNIDVRVIRAAAAENQGGYVIVGRDASEYITAIVPDNPQYLSTGVVGSGLLIFTNRRLFRWSGWSRSDFQLEHVVDTPCYAQSTVQRVDGAVIWFDGKEFVALAGQSIQSISKTVFPDTLESLVASYEQANGKKLYIPSAAWRSYYLVGIAPLDSIYMFHVPTQTWTRINMRVQDITALAGRVYAAADSTIHELWRSTETVLIYETPNILIDCVDAAAVERVTTVWMSKQQPAQLSIAAKCQGVQGAGRTGQVTIPAHTDPDEYQIVDATVPNSGTVLRLAFQSTGAQELVSVLVKVAKRSRVGG